MDSVPSELDSVVSDVVIVATVLANWSMFIPSTERTSEAALSSIVAIDGNVGVAIDGIATDVGSGTVIVNELEGRATTITDADVIDAAAAFDSWVDDEDVDSEVVVVSDVISDVISDVAEDDDDEVVVVEEFISAGFLVPSGSGITCGRWNCMWLGIGVLTGVGITVIVLTF